MTRGKQKIEAQRRNAERNQKPKGSQLEARAVGLKVICPICKVLNLIPITHTPPVCVCTHAYPWTYSSLLPERLSVESSTVAWALLSLGFSCYLRLIIYNPMIIISDLSPFCFLLSWPYILSYLWVLHDSRKERGLWASSSVLNNNWNCYHFSSAFHRVSICGIPSCNTVLLKVGATPVLGLNSISNCRRCEAVRWGIAMNELTGSRLTLWLTTSFLLCCD